MRLLRTLGLVRDLQSQVVTLDQAGADSIGPLLAKVATLFIAWNPP
jgi:hypothetical protein